MKAGRAVGGRRGTRGEAVWIFAGGPMQLLAAGKALERGYRLIVTDRNPACPCAPLASEVVPLDTFDIPGNLAAAKRLARKYAIRAVLAPAADCHETVANVGAALGLPAIGIPVSRLCRYKDLGRAALTRAGIPQPRSLAVTSRAEGVAFLKEIGGKGVVKATDNSGSRGFSAVRRPSDLTEEVFASAVDAGTTGRVVVEEMLVPLTTEPAEQSVETVWYNGSMYWLNWVDRLFRKDFLLFPSLRRGVWKDVSFGVELGHVNPALHPPETKRQVAEMVYRAGVALGMKRQRGGHILKADIMLTAEGPRILELTPRLSGGWDSSASTPARGGDFAGGALALALGERLDLALWHRHFAYRDPELFSSVLATVEAGAKDCIGRKFSIGTDDSREKAIGRALSNLREGRHVIPVVQ